MGARQPVSCLLLLATYLLIQIMFGRAVAEVPDDIRANLTRHGHALLIGVSRYDNDAWPPLLSVVDDIEDLHRALDPHFATVETLPNPTADAIRAKLREFMTGRWDQPDERLLVYYAGHGFTDYNIASRLYTGYITGKDTPACRGSDCGSALGKAIPFSYFDGLNRETRVLQVITLFDSCFSGLAIVRGPEDGATHYVADREREETLKPIRYYITAGGPNEKVPADGAFATLVIAGLNGEADTHKDGFFSAEELGNYLQRAIPVHTHQRLHPQRSSIADETGRLSSGQFFFLTGLASKTVESKKKELTPGILKDSLRLYIALPSLSNFKSEGRTIYVHTWTLSLVLPEDISSQIDSVSYEFSNSAFKSPKVSEKNSPAFVARWPGYGCGSDVVVRALMKDGSFVQSDVYLCDVPKLPDPP